ncbi:MAG: DUF4304 domain-containing protein [Acidobacteria bacterium]|nr:DUF4304 domain-containing protein [Acidobacteriota bacterium]
MKAFDDILKPLGYRRQASTWSKNLPHGQVLVNLQRSQWGLYYYVNLTLAFRGGRPAFVTARLGELTPEREGDAAGDFEDVPAAQVQEHSTRFAELARTYAVPWLAVMEDLTRLREYYRSSRFVGVPDLNAKAILEGDFFPNAEGE